MRISDWSSDVCSSDLLNATDTQLAALQARAMDLRTKLSGLEGRIVAAPEVEREYQAVTRDLASARAKYDEMLKRQMDAEDRKSVVWGKSVSVSVELGGGRIIKKKKNNNTTQTT